MKRLMLLVLAVAACAVLAGVAHARPIHDRYTVENSSVSPAGERCDFDYRIRYRLVFNDLIWGHFERVISHGTAYVAHTNLDTGYTLRERDRTVAFINEATGKGRTVGIQWKLRTPEGKLVFVRVGQIRYTLDGGVYHVTPHVQPLDTDPIVCRLLGGEAA